VDVRAVAARVAVAALAVGAALLSAGCGGDDARRAAHSAFLGDISKLGPGKGDDPSLVYISPEADFSAFDGVVIDPVTVWHAPGSSPGAALVSELRALAARFESAIRTRMQASIFEVAAEPRAGALRIRAAFSERGRDLVKLDLRQAPGPGADTSGNLSVDALAFLRGAIELEVVDAVTGERLAAAIDDHLVAAPGEEARDRLASGAATWREVEAFLDVRAQRLAARLSALHVLGDPEAAGPAGRSEDE
jgi:hypothetical protein